MSLKKQLMTGLFTVGLMAMASGCQSADMQKVTAEVARPMADSVTHVVPLSGHILYAPPGESSNNVGSKTFATRFGDNWYAMALAHPSESNPVGGSVWLAPTGSLRIEQRPPTMVQPGVYMPNSGVSLDAQVGTQLTRFGEIVANTENGIVIRMDNPPSNYAEKMTWRDPGEGIDVATVHTMQSAEYGLRPYEAVINFVPDLEQQILFAITDQRWQSLPHPAHGNSGSKLTSGNDMLGAVSGGSASVGADGTIQITNYATPMRNMLDSKINAVFERR